MPRFWSLALKSSVAESLSLRTFFFLGVADDLDVVVEGDGSLLPLACLVLVLLMSSALSSASFSSLIVKPVFSSASLPSESESA